MFATKQSTFYRKKFILYRKMSILYRKSVFVTLRLFTVKQLFNNKSQVRKAPLPPLGEGKTSFVLRGVDYLSAQYNQFMSALCYLS